MTLISWARNFSAGSNSTLPLGVVVRLSEEIHERSGSWSLYRQPRASSLCLGLSVASTPDLSLLPKTLGLSDVMIKCLTFHR